jgi:hypothetical protein
MLLWTKRNRTTFVINNPSNSVTPLSRKLRSLDDQWFCGPCFRSLVLNELRDVIGCSCSVIILLASGQKKPYMRSPKLYGRPWGLCSQIFRTKPEKLVVATHGTPPKDFIAENLSRHKERRPPIFRSIPPKKISGYDTLDFHPKALILWTTSIYVVNTYLPAKFHLVFLIYQKLWPVEERTKMETQW